MKVSRLRLTGLVAAPYSPFHEDGTLNPDAVHPMAEFLIESGVRGVFICGSTGEGLSLSTEERIVLADRWMIAVDGRIPVLVHVGHNSVVEARTLAAHAERIGAAAIAAIPPSYYKPAKTEDLVDYLARVAAAAPSLPFYYYHIPSMTGVSLPVPELLRQGRERIPTLNGVKFSHSDLMELQECLAVEGDFDIVFGYDEMLLAGLALGLRGAVGSTYNFAAPLYLRIIDAFERGDLATARREQLKSVKLVRTLYDFGLMRAGKAIVGLMGIDCGTVRSPLKAITPVETKLIYDRLRSLDIFDHQIWRAEPGKGLG